MMNKKINSFIAIGLVGLATLAAGYQKTAHAQTAEDFGYGSKPAPTKKTVQYAQSAEDFGYGSQTPSSGKKTWFSLRLDTGMIFPTDAVIVRGGTADNLKSDAIGWDVGVSFGATFNRNTLAHIDVNGVINYSRWGATIVPGNNDAGFDEGNRQLIENTMLFAEANWRPLASDKGLISPFIGLGLGMNFASWLNEDISLTPNYKKSEWGITGLFQIGTGFDWYFATNWALGAKYNYFIPFGKDIEVGNMVQAGETTAVIYKPSNFHLLNAVVTASF